MRLPLGARSTMARRLYAGLLDEVQNRHDVLDRLDLVEEDFFHDPRFRAGSASACARPRAASSRVDTPTMTAPQRAMP